MKICKKKGEAAVMEKPKIVRPVYDERDDEIDVHSKSSAWEFTAAAAQIFTIMCVVKGNPAWRGGLALIFLGMAANMFYRFGQYEAKSFFAGGLLLGAVGTALLIWFGISS